MSIRKKRLTGKRQLTSQAYLTFVAIDRAGEKIRIPPLIVETDDEQRECREAHARREQRLARKLESKSEI